MPVRLLSPEEKEAASPSLNAFAENAPPYPEIAQQCRDAYDQGHVNALYIPAVRAIFDATLDTLAQLDENELSREIGDRAEYAADLADGIVNWGITQDIFVRTYQRHPLLRGPYFREFPASRRELTEGTTEQSQGVLNSFGTATISDVQSVNGGSLRLLQQEGIDEEPSAVIARSTDLLVIAGIARVHAEDAIEYFGWPYVRTELLRLVMDDDVKVAFTEEAEEHIKSEFYTETSGCPARWVPDPDNPEHNLMESYFPRFVRFLVPTDATADFESGQD